MPFFLTSVKDFAVKMVKKKALISINGTGPCKQRVKDLFTNTNLTKIPDDQILPMDLYAIFCIPLYYFDADV
jgi:hypothetical protein